MNSPLHPLLLHTHMADREELLDVQPNSSMTASSDSAFEVSSDDENPDIRGRAKKRRSICKAMSDSLKIGRSGDISSSNEDVSDESMPIRRRLRAKPKANQVYKKQEDSREKSHSGYTSCSSLSQCRLSESGESYHSNNEECRTPSPSFNRENSDGRRKRKYEDKSNSTDSDSESRQQLRGIKRARKGKSSSSSSSSSNGEHRHRARRRTQSTCPECKSTNQPAKTTYQASSKTSRHMSCETTHSSRHIRCSNCRKSIKEVQSFVRVTMNRGEKDVHNEAVRQEEAAFLRENMGRHREKSEKSRHH